MYTEDESSTATEDEDDARARELRKQEVWLPVPPMSSDTDTGSETEVKIFQDSISTVNQDLFIFPESTFIHDPSITSPSITNIKSKKIESPKDDIIGSNIEKIEYINTVQPSMKVDGPTKKSVIDNGINITNQTIYSHMDIDKDLINDDNVLYSNNTDMNETNTNTNLIIDKSKTIDLSNESLTSQSLSTTESTHKISVSSNENLPDLIASSPKPSRQSSPSSLSDIGELIKEIFQDALMDIDVDNSIMKDYNNHKSILPKQDLMKTEINDDNSNKSDSLKLSINTSEDTTCPIVTVTSPSPTSETPLEKLCADSTKLTIPTEVIKRPKSEHKNTPFDNLKYDLKQRRIKHATKLPELRPLSVENAQFQMNKYFQGNINSNTKFDKKTTEKTVHNENITDMNDQMLDIKPKLSDKVDTKNLMKYFQLTKNNSNNHNNTKNQINNSVLINTKVNNDVNINNVKEEDKLDINISVKEFSQINKETEINDIDFNIKEFPQINKQTEISDVEDHLNLKEFTQISEQIELHDVEDYLFNDRNLQSMIIEKIEKIPTNNDSFKSSTNLSKSISVESTYIENKSIDQNIEKDDALYINSDCHSDNLPALESLNNVETFCAEISINEIDPLLKLNNIKISNNTDMPSHLNEMPKRPERKYSTHSNNNLSKNNILNTESTYTPEVPMRNKSSKAKISIAKESTIPSNMEAKSSKLDNLISSSNNKETTVQCGNSDLKKNNVQESLNRTEQSPVSVSNIHLKEKNYPSDNRPLLKRTFLHDSTKSVCSSKSDKTKKDKCIIS